MGPVIAAAPPAAAAYQAARGSAALAATHGAVIRDGEGALSHWKNQPASPNDERGPCARCGDRSGWKRAAGDESRAQYAQRRAGDDKGEWRSLWGCQFYQGASSRS